MYRETSENKIVFGRSPSQTNRKAVKDKEPQTNENSVSSKKKQVYTKFK